MIYRRPLMALGHPALALSPSRFSRCWKGTERGDTPSPARAGEGWGGVAWGHEGGRC